MTLEVTPMTNIFNRFKQQLEDYCEVNISDEQLIPFKEYYKVVSPLELEYECNEIQQYSPFGMTCPEPNIVLPNQVISDYSIVGQQKNVLSLTLSSGIKCIKFKYEEDEDIKIGKEIHILGKISKNEWMGRISYQIMIEDYKIRKD